MILAAACASQSPVVPDCAKDMTPGWPVTVSMLQLIVGSAELEGKRVQVIGYVHLEFEGQGIYLHEEDYRRSITNNGLWLDFRGPFAARLCPMNGPQDRYMIVEGVYHGGPSGHFGMWSGELTDISRFEPWSSVR
jgi:hypothetical protein